MVFGFDHLDYFISNDRLMIAMAGGGFTAWIRRFLEPGKQTRRFRRNGWGGRAPCVAGADEVMGDLELKIR
jgi:hypothetical protein